MQMTSILYSKAKDTINNLATDPSEKFDISDGHPEVIQQIFAEVELHNQILKPTINQLDLR